MSMLQALHSPSRSRPRDRRSVVFLQNSYYHFYYLARALRKRGWDALSVSFENPRGPHANYFHGEDLNLYSFITPLYRRNLRRFFQQAKERFQLMHFAGDGYLSFFPANYGLDEPPDILEWRALGKRVAYTVSGCNSGTAQSSVARWSSQTGAVNVCAKCVWELHPEVCRDQKNLAWGRKIQKYCDLIFSETLPALDYVQGSEKVVREPVTVALDPEFWRPGLEIPRKHRIERGKDEILVYHSFGNYDQRSRKGRNIKGTPAIRAAIERMQAEGLPVRLIFVTGMRNVDVRYIQAQADIIVDQLNYGRYGATAREGMMLGKPVICYINAREFRAEDELACLKEVPLVSASEQDVYEVLKNLVADPARRRKLGEAGRDYALKWHSADACALRYEKVYDRLMAQAASGERVDDPQRG